MQDTILFVLVDVVVPLLVGSIVSSRCSHPYLILSACCVGFGVFTFVSAEFHAAIFIALLFIFFAAVGYVLGRLLPPRYPKPPTKAA